jgi:uncharacterized protein
MKPGDHPEFFRLPPPEGRSRESSIVLDREGRFWHEGAQVTHRGMARAFASWIARHPDDGRYILTNGYDWSYFQVEGAPFFVERAFAEPDGSWSVELSDGTSEPLDPQKLRLDAAGALLLPVKSGQFFAQFSRFAQLSLAPHLEPGPGGSIWLKLGDRRVELPQGSPEA